MAVSDACKADRLKACVVRDPETGRVAGITDPILADREWEANTDLTKAPPAMQVAAFAREQAFREAHPDAPGGDDEELTLANASMQDKLWAAKKKKLEYFEAAGELVSAATVKSKIVDVFVACKTKLLGLPSLARQQLPHLTVDDIAVLDGLVRRALEDLATGDE